MTHDFIIPGHALHGKGLQGEHRRDRTDQQPGQSSLATPLINCLSNAGEPLFNRWLTAYLVSSSVLNRVSFVRAFEKSSSTVSVRRWGARGTVVCCPDWTDDVPSFSAPPLLADLSCAVSTRPVRSVFEFWVRKVKIIWKHAFEQIPVKPKTRTYYERIGSKRPTERPRQVGQALMPT